MGLVERAEGREGLDFSCRFFISDAMDEDGCTDGCLFQALDTIIILENKEEKKGGGDARQNDSKRFLFLISIFFISSSFLIYMYIYIINITEYSFRIKQHISKPILQAFVYCQQTWCSAWCSMLSCPKPASVLCC